jgi:hypothetical protein
MTYVPVTDAARALLNAASDPDAARAALIPADFAQLGLQAEQALEASRRDKELLAQLRAVDTAAAVEAARKALAQLELDHAMAGDAERKRLAAAIKASRAQLEEIAQAHRTRQPQIELLLEREAQHAERIADLKRQCGEALMRYAGNSVQRMLGAEFRAAVLGMQPLLRFAAAIAAGAQAHGVSMALQDLRVANPANGREMLSGTRFYDHENTHRLPGTSIEQPTVTNLADGWMDDPCLLAVYQIAAEPVRTMRALSGWRSVHQVEEEESQRRAEEERDRTPKGSPLTKRPEPPPSEPVAQPSRPGFQRDQYTPRTRPGGRMQNGVIAYPGVEQLDAEMGHQLLRDPLDGSPYAGN